MAKWCAVTIVDGAGQQYSLDVQARSSYDAAHLYLTHVVGPPGCGMPVPTTETVFEVVANGRIHRSPPHLTRLMTCQPYGLVVGS